jgi:SAM-dependent methyltransferase
VVAVEPDPRFHSRFLDGVDGVSLVKGLSSQLKDDDFDAVITVNVMEHIEDDLGEFRNQHRLLEKKGGHLCCLVPARPEIFAPLDEHFGHFRRYTKKQLTDTVEKAGFRVVKVFYFNWVGYFAWAVRFKIFRKMNFDLGQVRLFDRRIFPLSHWFEKKVMRPPIGQSLIIIAHPKTE